MTPQLRLAAALAATLLALAGCASTSDVMELGQDHYFVSSRMSGPGGDWDEARKLALEKARAHCSPLGREAVVDDMKTHGARGWTPITVDLKFRCVAKA